MHIRDLAALTQSILDSQSLDEYISSAENLSLFYKATTENFTHSAINEAVVKGGVALSSLGAADCTDDYLRTVFFIKGVHAALSRLIKLQGRPVTILYAGCGPYATLLLPLLPLFSSNDINAIILDINQPSLDCVKNIIETAGLQDYNLTLVCADATLYNKPDDFVIDLCISETMHHALTREPQVAIVKNLAPQMPSHGILIPQSISVDLAFSFFAKEPYLKDGKMVKTFAETMQYPLRVYADRLFSIDKDHFPDTVHNQKFESKLYAIPEDPNLCPDVCVLTEVQIFEDISLKPAESYITNPYCVASLLNFAGHDAIRLTYDFSEIPKWYCSFK